MNKKSGIFIILTLIIAFALGGTACAAKNDGGTTYSVTFNANGGVFLSGGTTIKKTVNAGDHISDAEIPTRDNYIFYGWLNEATGVVKVDLSTTAINGDTTFYAGWREAVSVTYYCNYPDVQGGIYMTEVVGSGTLLSEPTAPQHQGYTFECWTTDKEGDNVWAFGTDKITHATELYAQWKESDEKQTTHKITYVLDDGTSTAAVNASGNPTSFTEGSPVKLANPSRLAFTFEGWYADAQFENKVIWVGESETNDVTLYAKWSYNYPFFVTSYDNGWTKYSEFTAKSDDDEEKQTHALFPLVKGDGENRIWDGKTYVAERVYITQGFTSQNHGFKIINASDTWYGAGGISGQTATNITVNSSGYYTVKIEASGTNPASITVTASLTKYRISYETGKANIGINDEECVYGGLLTKPTVVGYIISKWYRDAERRSEWDFATDVVTGDTILYAGAITPKSVDVIYTAYDKLAWADVKNKVSFGDALDLSYSLAEGYEKSALTVRVNGAEVVGNSYTVNQEGIITITVDGSIVKNTYTVTFKNADGSTLGTVTVEHGETVTALTPVYITGMRHTGWSGALTNVASDLELIATFEYIDYTLMFDSMGGSDVPNPTKHYGDAIEEPKAPAKDDCVFIGWYTDEACSVGNEFNFTDATMPAKNLTLYAKWEQSSAVTWYTVTFLYEADGEEFTKRTISENSTVTAPISKPNKTGYIFDKWFDAATNAEYAFGGRPSDGITLYATWKLQAPTVTINDVSGEYKVGGYTLNAATEHALDGVEYIYKWYKDGVLIQSANSGTYIVSSVSDSGTYSVEVAARYDGLTSELAVTSTTVSITKAKLPEINAIGFKNGDAYTGTIVFDTASFTDRATHFGVTVRDGNGQVVVENDIAIDAAKELTIDAALKGEYTVQITYKGITFADSENVDNVTAEHTVRFKGNGTAACAFDVDDAADLGRVKKYPTAHFVQTADIEATGISALFTAVAPFTGVYDGNGKSIADFTDGLGLFGYIGSGATVKNFNISVALDSSSLAFMGGVAAENSGTVIGVTVVANSTIYSKVGAVNDNTGLRAYAAGGIVGKNSGTVSYCVNYARITGYISFGGIVGYNAEGAVVLNCKNYGLIGTNATTEQATSVMSWAGGLVGYNCGSVVRSVNNGNVTVYKHNKGSGNGNNYFGGLVGENAATGTVSECLNTGLVRCDYAAAGLVSRNSGKIESCINTGDVDTRYTVSSGTCLGSGTITKCVMLGMVNKSGSSSGGGGNSNANGESTATYCFYLNGSALGGDTNAKYDAATLQKVVAMLIVLGDKFAYDGENTVLAFGVDTVDVTLTADGQTYAAIAVKKGISISLSEVTGATKKNHTFKGWYSADDASKTYVTAFTVEDSASFEADFDKNQYTISFDADGGSAVASVTKDYDEALTSPDSAKTGYTLVGWFEQGSDAPFDFTAERDGDVSLKALWKADKYTVTFVANGGTLAQDNMPVEFGGKYGELPTPSKSGHKFLGWYSQNGNADGSGWGVNITADTVFEIVGDVTVYAKWEEVENRLVLDYNYDGSPDALEIGVSDSDISIKFSVTRVGYTLKGVATTANGEVEYTVELTKAQFDSLRGEGAEVTLYAVWEPTEYTIEVDLAGGGWTVGQTVITDSLKYTIENTEGGVFTVPGETTPTRDGYTFGGWAITRDGKVEQSIGLSDGYKITASWNAVEHTITLIDSDYKTVDAENKTIMFTIEDETVSLPSYDTVEKDGKVYCFKGWKRNDVDAPFTTLAVSALGITGETPLAITLTQVWDEVVLISGEADLSGFDGKTREEIAAMTYAVKVTDESSPLYGKTLEFVTDRKELGSIAEEENIYFYQTADIADAPSRVFGEFGGVYNGGGHSIGATTAVVNRTGLFNTIGKSGVVKNLTVYVAVSTGSQAYTGGVASVNKGKIIGVTVNGSVKSTTGTVNSGKTATSTGGIVGNNNAGGIVSGCTNNATISGKVSVGGIVGYNMAGAVVSNCTNNGAMGSTSAAMSYAGGIVGYNGGTVSRSINTENVYAALSGSSSGNGNNYLSGIVAENISGGNVTECINYGNIRCDYEAAGLVSKNDGIVEYCINTGDVRSRYKAGGGTTEGSGEITKCLMTGNITVDSSSRYGVCNSSATATDCYYAHGDAPSNGSGNAKYDDSTVQSRAEMLAVLGENFVWDNESGQITLAFRQS